MDKSWWRSAVIYQIYPRSFADSNGDGIGDLPGITARLPHLSRLGVDAIWLSPFYRSPMVDGGYDVADHRAVDPMFGTLTDFDALLAAAHADGLRVLIDLVPNHTSAQHPWFRAALAGDVAARRRYHFREQPNDWRSVFGGSAWERGPDGVHYLHLFDPAQPDLNWTNPEVRDDFAHTLRFWLDRGVDGFRVDVAHGLVKAPGLPDCGHPDQHNNRPAPYFDQDEVHDVHRDWRAILDSYPGDRIAVAEVWGVPPDRLARYAEAGALHQAFNFDFLDAPWSAPQLRAAIERSLATLAPVGAPPTWAMGNHDRHRQVTRYGSAERARAALLLLLALPGSAYLYQGDELGLPEVLDLPAEVRQDPFWVRSGGTDPGRDGCRIPLPWSGDSPPFGFSEQSAWLPPPPEWRTLTVAAQEADPASMLAFYRTALRARRIHPALGHGSTESLDWLPSPADALIFRRPPGLVCAVNLGPSQLHLPREYGLPLCASGRLAGRHLPPDTAVWLNAN